MLFKAIDVKIGFIGAGNLTSNIAQGFIKSGKDIILTIRSPTRFSSKVLMFKEAFLERNDQYKLSLSLYIFK